MAPSPNAIFTGKWAPEHVTAHGPMQPAPYAGLAVAAGLGDERLEQALVLLHLGVPQDSQGETHVRVLEPLERPVLGPRRLDEPLPHAPYSLVVARLHLVAPADDLPEPVPSFTSTGCSENVPSTSRWPS